MGNIATCGTDISSNSSEFFEGWQEEFNHVDGTYDAVRVIDAPWAERYTIINNIFPGEPTILQDGELIPDGASGIAHPSWGDARAVSASIVPLAIGTPTKASSNGAIAYTYARITIHYKIDPTRSDLDPFANVNQLPGSSLPGAGIRAEYEFDTTVETITLPGRMVKEVGKAKMLGDIGVINIIRPIVRLTVRYPELRLARIPTSLGLAGKINTNGILLGAGTTNAVSFGIGKVRYDGPRISTKVKFNQTSKAIFDVTHSFSIAPVHWNYVPVATDDTGVKYKNTKLYVMEDLRPLIYTFT